MPTLFDTLRERWNVLSDSARDLQNEVQAAGGLASPEQDAALDDVQRQLDELAPRLERQSNLETRISATSQLLARAPAPTPARPANDDPLYRDAGSYLTDFVGARQGDRAALDRLGVYMQRAPANQTTADNPGIVPDPIVGGVLDFIDARRPVADAIGIKAMPAYPTFHRPHVSQHTQVGAQAGEKTEVPSRKMIIDRLTVTAVTYGGYVDLSLQDRDWSNPAIMGILVSDLAGQYAIQTETKVSTDLAAAVTATATAGGMTAQQILTAVFEAAGTVYGASSLMPDVVFCSVDAWAVIGPVWYGRPGDSGGSGDASSFNGSVAGLRLVVGPRLPAATVIVGATPAAEVYEQRYGTLQAVEVSLLGMQLGYVGYFADLIIQPNAFCKVAGLTIP